MTFHPNTPFTAKLTPKFGQKWTIWGLLWPKSHMGVIVDYSLQKYSNVKFGSQKGIIRPVMRIVHEILSQPQHFLPKLPLVWAKKEQLQDWFGLNHKCAWLKTAAESLQSWNRFIRKVYKAWDRWESYMAFLPKHTIYCQADPQIWPKMDSLGATLAQITCAHDCRLWQKHSKLKIGSGARIIKPRMESVHCIIFT